MSDESEKPLVSKKGIVVDLFLSLIFFFFMREVLVPHVPSQDPSAILIVSSMTSLCMTGVFLDCCQYASCYLGGLLKKTKLAFPSFFL